MLGITSELGEMWTWGRTRQGSVDIMWSVDCALKTWRWLSVGGYCICLAPWRLIFYFLPDSLAVHIKLDCPGILSETTAESNSVFVPPSFSQPLWLACWLETWLSDDVSTMIVKYGGQRQNINRYLFKRKMLDGLQLLNFIKIQTDKCHINLTLTGNETRLLNKCCDEKHTKLQDNHFLSRFPFDYLSRVEKNEYRITRT